MDKTPEERFEDAKKDLVWSKWFEKQTKKDLWILMVESNESGKNHLTNMLENQRAHYFWENKDLEERTLEKSMFWITIGILIGLIIAKLN